MISYDKYADDKKGGMLVFEKADGSMECADVSALSDPSRRISCHYDSIHWLDEERAVVGQNGLFGIMDREGNLTEPITLIPLLRNNCNIIFQRCHFSHAVMKPCV